MSDRNLYQILGASPSATPVAIRKAYKKAMLRTHPDKARHGKGSPSAFIAVQKAYKVLSDESSRRRYDAQLRAKKDLKPNPPTKPYVGIRIAIMLDGRWVKGFLKAFEESSTRSVRISCSNFLSLLYIHIPTL